MKSTPSGAPHSTHSVAAIAKADAAPAGPSESSGSSAVLRTCSGRPCTMRLVGVAIGDLVRVDKRGRLFYAQVVDFDASELLIEPLDRHNSYRRPSAREVLAHWRKASTPRHLPTPPPPLPSGQLALYLR